MKAMGLLDHYILNPDHTIRKCGMMEWAEFFEDSSSRRVALTVIAPGIYVSTTFIGLDHNFSGRGPPLLFETMGFDDFGENMCQRWATWDQAAAGHDLAVAEIRARLGSNNERVLPEPCDEDQQDL